MEDRLAKCDNCQFETEVRTSEFPPTDPHLPGKKCKLCEVCSETFLGFALLASEQVPDVELYQSIAWIANRILQEIAEFRVRVVKN